MNIFVNAILKAHPIKRLLIMFSAKVYIKKEVKPFYNFFFYKTVKQTYKMFFFSVDNKLIKFYGCPIDEDMVFFVFCCILASLKRIYWYLLNLFLANVEFMISMLKENQSNRWTLQCMEIILLKYKTCHRIESNQFRRYADYSKWRSKIQIIYNMKLKYSLCIKNKKFQSNKCNAINGELHWAKEITFNFDIKIKRIAEKYIAAGSPNRFCHSTINNFNDSKDDLILRYLLF